MQNRFMINHNDRDGIAINPEAKQGIWTQQLHLEPSAHLTTDSRLTKIKTENPQHTLDVMRGIIYSHGNAT